MSTTTLAPRARTTVPQDWRRICHYYRGEDQISICGTATRQPGEDHGEAECVERGHAVCVVCAVLLEG